MTAKREYLKPELLAAARNMRASFLRSDDYDDQVMSLYEALATAEQRGRDETAGKWVASSKQLPETAAVVLVLDHGRRRVAWRSVFGWYGDHDALLTGVTHWHPLPDPPGKTP